MAVLDVELTYKEIFCTTGHLIVFFHIKVESVQYNTCLAITGAIRGSPKGKEISRVRTRIYSASLLIVLYYKVFKNVQ